MTWFTVKGRSLNESCWFYNAVVLKIKNKYIIKGYWIYFFYSKMVNMNFKCNNKSYKNQI